MKALIFTENLNDTALREAIEGVEDNNDINDGEWSDWQGVHDIEEVYGIEDLCDEGRKVLDRAIESNGESLKHDLPAVEIAVWGHNYSGSFWNRKKN